MTTTKEEFQMTSEELQRLEKAMKDAEFRKLLVEYAEEISNPENRKKYEAEITQMENERGMDVKFVNPKPGFVVKTHQLSDSLKIFVNICQNEHIQKATATFTTKKVGSESQAGQQWSIPHSLSVGREDVDKAGGKCMVYDVVFNPDTYQKALQDARFKKLLINTAVEAVERQFNIQLDKENLKLPKLKFKGVAKSTVIRTPKSGDCDNPPAPPELDIGGVKLPYPYDNQPEKSSTENTSNTTSKQKKKSNKLKIEEESGPVTPKYTIVYRGHLDLQNFTNARDVSQGTRPKELVVRIELPLLDSAANVELDVFERQLILECASPSYYLDMPFTYPVKEEEGTAKFDKSKRQLVVTLPVVPAEVTTVDSLFSPVEELSSVSDKDDELVEVDSGLSSPCSTESNSEQTNTTAGQSPREENGISDVTGETPSDINANSTKNLSSTREENISDDDDEQAIVDIPREQSLEEAENLLNEYLNQQNFGTETEEDIAEDIITGLPCMYFQCPPYTYHQDIETVTFVLSVSDVSLESVSLGFNTDRCYISFPGHPNPLSSTPVPDFSLYISFLDNCFLDTEKCQVDVSAQNVVLTLHKVEGSQRLWDGFLAGPGEDKLMQKIFLTDRCVEFVLGEIEKQDPWASPQSSAAFNVTNMSEEKVTIEVESQTIAPANDKPNLKVEEHLTALRTKDITMGIPPQYCEYLSKEEQRTDPTGESSTGQSSELHNKINGEACGAGVCNEKRDKIGKGNENDESENNNDIIEKDLPNNAGDVSCEGVVSNSRPFSPQRFSRMKSRSLSTDSEGGISTDDFETESQSDDEDDEVSSESSSYKKQVRFNLVPEIREFNSKKKNRRKRKKNKKRKQADSNGELSSSPSSPGTSPVDGVLCFPYVNNDSEGDGEQAVAAVLPTIKEKEECHAHDTAGRGQIEEIQNCQFENSLIFELD